MNKSLNDYRDEIFNNAEKHGFHERTNFAEKLMLVVSELGEALEADRDDRYVKPEIYGYQLTDMQFRERVRGSVEEEIIDAIIRLLDICGILKIDVDWLIEAKMKYNSSRPPLHGRKYG